MRSKALLMALAGVALSAPVYEDNFKGKGGHLKSPPTKKQQKSRAKAKRAKKQRRNNRKK